jgi:hypothetical protein
MLDDGSFAPLSGGTGSDDGLQMIPKLAGVKCECGGAITDGKCADCGKTADDTSS